MNSHGERKHSKFSASGSERWMNCSGSVALCEPLPDTTNPAAQAGTNAHENREKLLEIGLTRPATLRNLSIESLAKLLPHKDADMVFHGRRSAERLLDRKRLMNSDELLVEGKVYLKFIHPEMFGTLDAALVQYFGALYIEDYKYGKHAVSPISNMQMIFYALGIAHLYHWNFNDVTLAIDQPRLPSYRGPVSWKISIGELKKYVDVFKRAVESVEKYPDKFTEGSWCHFCRGRKICPIKRDDRIRKAESQFTPIINQ